MYTSLFCLYKKSGLLPSIFVFYSSEHNLVFYQFLISLLSIRKKENLGFNEICISSGLLVAYGDSLIPKVVVGFAAYGGKRLPHLTLYAVEAFKLANGLAILTTVFYTDKQIAKVRRKTACLS